MEHSDYSYLFAPVISANSWLSLVSQGGSPILLAMWMRIVVVGGSGGYELDPESQPTF
jgi:hypothetical protein